MSWPCLDHWRHLGSATDHRVRSAIWTSFYGALAWTRTRGRTMWASIFVLIAGCIWWPWAYPWRTANENKALLLKLNPNAYYTCAPKCPHSFATDRSVNTLDRNCKLLLFIFQESCTNFPYILNIIMLFIHSTGFLREKGDRGLWHLNRHSLFKTKCPNGCLVRLFVYNFLPK